jgi:hypothetical protein
MNYVALFFAGAFLCNAIPHLARGLQGDPFPSPFAKPRGVGDSPPWVNVLWGLFNALVGLWLLSRHPVEVGLNPDFLVLFAGVLVLGIYASVHFDRVRRGKPAK